VVRHADIIVASPSSPSFLPLWLTSAPKRGRADHGRCRNAPGGHSAHPCRPRTAALPAGISRPPPRLHELPTLATSGFHPIHATTHRRRRRRGEEEEKEESTEGATPMPPRESEATRGAHTSTPRLPYFLYWCLPHPLPVSSLSSPPPSSSGHADRR
jgi:hypothetical protein